MKPVAEVCLEPVDVVLVVGDGRAFAGLERAVDGRLDQVVILVVLDPVVVLAGEIALRTMKPVHMLSWPCGTMDRPCFMAKICLPKTGRLGSPSTLLRSIPRLWRRCRETWPISRAIELHEREQIGQVHLAVEFFELDLEIERP